MQNFDAIRLRVASPDDILRWSNGEVTKPETINYRTQRAEKDGLFSERIFGPTKDWECYCGKYKRIRYKGIICDKCGVEVAHSSVRRERMGHIELATPVAHIWFLKTAPSKIGLLLDVPSQKLERVIYYAAYIVTAVNEDNKKRSLAEIENEYKSRVKGLSTEEADSLRQATNRLIDSMKSLTPGTVLNEAEYFDLARRFGDVFDAGTGASAIRRILENLDLEAEAKKIEKNLEKFITKEEDGAENRLFRRIKVIRSMIKNGMRPEWMIMTRLPVLPPDLRPMVALDGGRYATSDLNDLYRRVINRNNRLKKLLELHAPEVIVVNEKRMLQEAVDALVDNSARLGAQQLSSLRRPLRSLADMLKGKQGRFRQNLLGKRVDYSGRSVIIIGPKLKLDECGLPKKMALELFKPFVISKILSQGLAHNIRNANRLIESAPPEVWAILEEVITDKKVLLNRAPTLHRLSVQAFKPVLTEYLAVQIPPMVCAAFNADFDGDQMAVHLPLSEGAQREASEIMLSSKNLLKPASGDPVVNPTQDIVLGTYYLTSIDPTAKGTGQAFVNETDALSAYYRGYIAHNSLIKVGSKLETTAGRLVFNETLPEGFVFMNETMKKKALANLVNKVINDNGPEAAVDFLDKVKNLGFRYATSSGITWAIDDLTMPKDKKGIIEKADSEITLITDQYQEGLLTNAERRERVIAVWEKTKAEISKLVPAALSENNPVFLIIDSGARGSWTQTIQMTGMKGNVVNSRGETIELPIKASYKEGLSVLEYFISTHGARKGSTDTALKTAQAGYLTRRLVDVAQDLITREEDCGTKESIELFRADGEQFGLSFGSRAYSRIAAEDIKSGQKVIVKEGEVITAELSEEIEKSKNDSIKVFSPLTCKTLYGVCSKCYGLDLGNNNPIKLGEAVGIVAAQSIGEPGTQLTMRTFHYGGVTGVDITQGLPRVEELFEVRPPKGKAVIAEEDGAVMEIEESGSLKIVKLSVSGKKNKVLEYSVPRLSSIFVKVGDEVKKGDQISEGNMDLREILEYRGVRDVERYIVNEVQKTYVSNGSAVHDKHIEVIVRQMFGRVRIKDAGETDFVVGDVIDKSKFLEDNRAAKKDGKLPAKATQLLLGVTKTSLSTESFLSSASFQETNRVLVNAAIEGKEDILRGLKENVIIGRLIPIGTGVEARKRQLKTLEEGKGQFDA